MSGASPSDLAVVFRALPRRRREALGDTPPEEAAALLSRLDALVGSVAEVLDVAADPMAIADAIEARPADSWTDDDLDALRSEALHIGRVLRDLEALAPED